MQSSQELLGEGPRKLFSVSKSAVQRWWKRYTEEAGVSAKPKLGSKSKINSQELEDFVIKNPGKNLKEIGLHFKLGKSAIHRKLQSLGFRYKKKPSPIWRQMKLSEPSI